MSARFQPSASLGDTLQTILSPQRVSQTSADRLIYSHDRWPKALLAVRDNKASLNPPDYVVWPETTAEVAELLALAQSSGTPVVPWGGGSGSCGAAMATAGGIILDLKRLGDLEQLSPVDGLVTAGCGILGQTLEDQLNLHGLTLGHSPETISCATLGGWLATRSAGQLSPRYGKIEEMVRSLEVVLGNGQVLQCTAEQQPNLIPILLGSEGTLGVITRATLRVWPLPAERLLRAYSFPSMQAGSEAFRETLQLGLRPAVMRLHDKGATLWLRLCGQGAPQEQHRLLETLDRYLPGRRSALGQDLKQRLLRAALNHAGAVNRLGERLLPRLNGGCLAILGFDGDPLLVEAEARLCHSVCLAAGATDLGSEPAQAWYQRRQAPPYWQSPLYAESGGLMDTIDVAISWERLQGLYREVHRELSPLALLLTRFDHPTPDGCALVFTFATAAEGRIKGEALYDEIWRRALEAALKAGGTISHHSGVGLTKAGYLAEEHGTTLAVYRQLKAISDPAGILNPGKMGL